MTVMGSPAKKLDIKKPRQKRSVQTRAKILQAAYDLFTEYGFDETTTHLIAERSGISVGGLYAHFKNKEEMFLTLMEQRSRNSYEMTQDFMAEIRDKAMSVQQCMGEMIPRMWAAHSRHGKLNLEMNKFVHMNPQAAEIHDYWENKEVEALRDWLRESHQDQCPGDLDEVVCVMSRSIHEVFQFLYKNSFKPEQERMDERKILQVLVRLCESMLGPG